MISIRDFEDKYTLEGGWTQAFAQALAELEKSGGGTLVVPPGVYETGSIELGNNMTLYLESGARLCFLPDTRFYPITETEFEGRREALYRPCIFAKDAEHVSVAGAGVLDGQGEYWWEKRFELPAGRPYLIGFENCRRVKVLDVELVNSPVWTVHPLYCEDVEIRGITIHNPWNSPNTDGINPDSCRNVRISDCLVDVGDDCITLKAGSEETPQKHPCENITITNCNMIHGHGGVVIGSEMSGGVRNVVISNCVFQDTDRGIRVKTRRGRGGCMERILINNVMMDRVMCPFVFQMFYQCGIEDGSYMDKFPHEVEEGTPAIRNIQIRNCMITRASACAGFFYGLPEMPVENVSITDTIISMEENASPAVPAMMKGIAPMSGKGIYMRFTENTVFRDIQVLGAEGKALDADGTVKWRGEII